MEAYKAVTKHESVPCVLIRQVWSPSHNLLKWDKYQKKHLSRPSWNLDHHLKDPCEHIAIPSHSQKLTSRPKLWSQEDNAVNTYRKKSWTQFAVSYQLKRQLEIIPMNARIEKEQFLEKYLCKKIMHVSTGPLANTFHPLLMSSWKLYSFSLIPSASFSLISPKWWKEYVVKWALHLQVTVGLGERRRRDFVAWESG